jgi:hypothetical protein
MQLIPRYLVKNKIDVVLDVAGFVVEYRPVYQRQIQIYRGIDNTVQFRMFNADQKPIAIFGQTPRFIAFDENKNLVLDLDATVLDDGSSRQTRGTFAVTITENHLLNIDQQYLSYVVFLEDDLTGDKTLTYANSHFGNGGIIYISSHAFPAVKPPLEITQFLQTDLDRWESESASAEPAINNNEALHTIVIYSDTYAGTLTLQTTLDQQITESTRWANLSELVFTGEETEPTVINLVGIYKYFKFKTSDNPEKISKILIKN